MIRQGLSTSEPGAVATGHRGNFNVGISISPLTFAVSHKKSRAKLRGTLQGGELRAQSCQRQTFDSLCKGLPAWGPRSAVLMRLADYLFARFLPGPGLVFFVAVGRSESAK
jgi:hypothetical protein